MSVESWSRRASGLLVPTLGFADHKLGRWMPGEGPCCLDCDCIKSSEYTLDVTFADIGNDVCADCVGYNTTYQVTVEEMAGWPGGCSYQSYFSPSCGASDTSLNVQVFKSGGLCYVRVYLIMTGMPGNYSLFYELVGDASPFDFSGATDIPFIREIWQAGFPKTSHCDVSITTCTLQAA